MNTKPASQADLNNVIAIATVKAVCDRNNPTLKVGLKPEAGLSGLLVAWLSDNGIITHARSIAYTPAQYHIANVINQHEGRPANMSDDPSSTLQCALTIRRNQDEGSPKFLNRFSDSWAVS